MGVKKLTECLAPSASRPLKHSTIKTVYNQVFSNY